MNNKNSSKFNGKILIILFLQAKDSWILFFIVNEDEPEAIILIYLYYYIKIVAKSQ